MKCCRLSPKRTAILVATVLVIALLIPGWFMLFSEKPATKYDIDEILSLSPLELEITNKAGMRLIWVAVHEDQQEMAEYNDRLRRGTSLADVAEAAERGENTFKLAEVDPDFTSHTACDSFFISHPITEAQFAAVMSSPAPDDGDVPIRDVTWEEAVTFCDRLSELHEEKAAGRVYRLPNIHEWGFSSRNSPSSGFRVIEVSRSKSRDSENWKTQRKLSANDDWRPPTEGRVIMYGRVLNSTIRAPVKLANKLKSAGTPKPKRQKPPKVTPLTSVPKELNFIELPTSYVFVSGERITKPPVFPFSEERHTVIARFKRPPGPTKESIIANLYRQIEAAGWSRRGMSIGYYKNKPVSQLNLVVRSPDRTWNGAGLNLHPSRQPSDEHELELALRWMNHRSITAFRPWRITSPPPK